MTPEDPSCRRRVWFALFAHPWRKTSREIATRDFARLVFADMTGGPRPVYNAATLFRLFIRSGCRILDGRLILKQVSVSMVCFRSLVGWVTLAIVAVPCLAQAQPKPKPRGPLSQSIHAGGIGRLVPGDWGAVGVDLVNPADHPVEALSAIYFEKHPNLQFGRKLWVPARARLTTSYPVLTPGDLPRDKDRTEIHTILLDRTGKEEVLMRGLNGQMMGDATLSAGFERPITGIIDDIGDDLGGDMVMAMRLARNLTRRMAAFPGDFTPASQEYFQGLDHLALMSDRLAKDSGGLSAIREWLHNGGRLWIMLDQVQPETVHALLGDSFTYQPVDQAIDRIGLSKVALKSTLAGGLGIAVPPQEFEEPVDFVRVLTPQGTVIHTVDGWPASFQFPVGRGRVLCTTLGPRAWIRLRGPKDPKVNDVLKESRYIANEFLTELAFEFMGVPTEPPALKPADFHEFVSEQIGYRIVGRSLVLFVLGTFCVALIGIGSWLAYRDQLAMLGWIGPLAAAGAATILVLLGSWSRSAVPATAAIAQLAEVSEDADDIQMTGLMALYQPAESDSPLGARNGGVFLPDMSGQDGKTRRLVWTDLNAWHWENLTLPAGMRTAPFSYSGKLAKPISARATFGPTGLVGTLDAGPFQDLADGLVVMPGQPMLAAKIEANGKFSAGPQDVLAAGEYIGGTILSDELRRRRAIYKKLLEIPGAAEGTKLDEDTPALVNTPIRTYPTEPKLLVWGAPYDTQFVLPEGAQRVGSALITIPLKFEHPAPGTTMVIPAPCVTYVSGGNSGAYIAREKRWMSALNTASTTTLRFILPREVMPLKLKQAKLTVKIDAPGRTLSITAGRDAGQVSLASRPSPVGTVQLAIDRTDALAVDADGTFLLSLDVGAAQGEVREATKGATTLDTTKFPTWKIESVQLEVTAIAE